MGCSHLNTAEAFLFLILQTKTNPWEGQPGDAFNSQLEEAGEVHLLRWDFADSETISAPAHEWLAKITDEVANLPS